MQAWPPVVKIQCSFFKNSSFSRRGEYYVRMRSTAPRKLDDWLGRSRQWPKNFFNELNRNMKNFHNFAINTLKVYPYILLKYIFERLWCIQGIYWKLPLGEYENSESSEISETSGTSDKMRWCPSFPSFPSFSFRVFVLHYRKWGVFTKIRKSLKARKHRTKWNPVRAFRAFPTFRSKISFYTIENRMC